MKSSGEREERGGWDGCLVNLTVDLALGEEPGDSAEYQAARLMRPKRRQIGGGAAASWAATGCSLFDQWVFLSQDHVRDVFGHYSWAYSGGGLVSDFLSSWCSVGEGCDI